MLTVRSSHKRKRKTKRRDVSQQKKKKQTNKKKIICNKHINMQKIKAIFKNNKYINK